MKEGGRLFRLSQERLQLFLTTLQDDGFDLKALKDELHSWIKAVGSYHSRTPAYFAVYRSKVFAAWRQEQKNQRTQVHEELAAAKEGRIENLAFRHAGPVAALVAAFNE